MNKKLLNLSDSDKVREEEARKNPRYNSESKKWVVNVIDGKEVSVIRQNFQHGFISWGWYSSSHKILIYAPYDHEDGSNDKIRNRMVKVAKQEARTIAHELNVKEFREDSK